MENFSPGRCSQYATLFFKLLIPFNVLRWILVFVAALWGVVVWLRWSDNWGFLLPIAIAITMLMAFILLSLVPNQIIALASSRPVSLLGNSRRTLLVFLFVFAAAISLMLCCSIRLSEELSAIQSLVLVITLIVSLLLQLCVFVCSRWPNGQGFVFVLAWVWVQVASWLLTLNPLLLLLAWFTSWLVFSRWWLQWQPKKYQSNSMVTAINDSRQAAAARNTGFLFISGKADSWLGSRFFGAPDGWRSRSQLLMIVCITFLIAPIPTSLLMGKESFQLLIHSPLLVLLVMFFTASVAQGMAGNFARNLRHIWLYSSGGRLDILGIAQRLYVREMGILSLVCIVMGILVEFIWGQWRGAEVWFCAALTLLLANTVSFYLAWWVYLRSQGNMLWCNWVGGVAVMLMVTLFMATGFLFPLPFDWKGISISWMWLLQLMLIGVLYKSVSKRFYRIDMVRAM